MGLAEIFKLSLLNTLLGMGTVFIVLIFVAFIISLMKYINPKKAAGAAAPAEQPMEIIEEEGEGEDFNLIVAVITAALHAKLSEEGLNPSDYIVRSIRRN